MLGRKDCQHNKTCAVGDEILRQLLILLSSGNLALLRGSLFGIKQLSLLIAWFGVVLFFFSSFTFSQ